MQIQYSMYTCDFLRTLVQWFQQQWCSGWFFLFTKTSTFYSNSQKHKLKLQMNVIADMTHSNQETHLDRRQAARRQSWRYRWEGSLGRRLWTVVWWPAHSETHCCSSVEESVPGGHLEPPGAEQRRQTTVNLQNLQHGRIHRINLKFNSL